MKFNEAQIHNVLAIEKARVQLGGQGLVLIQGDNRDDPSADSNGAGKSSIVDAICWCLYGVTARGVSGDAVVNSKAGKGAHVRLSIEDAGRHVVIIRNRKPNALTISIDGVDASRGTERETQAVIEQVLGCSLDVFMAAIYAGQEAMPDIPGMTDKQLKVLVEESAGITVLEKAYEHAREKWNAAKRDVSFAENMVARFADAVKKAEDNFRIATARQAEFEIDRLKRIDNSKLQVNHYSGAAKLIKAELDLTDLPALRGRAMQVQTEIDGYKSQQDEKKKLDDAVNKLYAEFHTAEREVKTKTRLVLLAENSLKNVKAKIGEPCDGCGRPFDEAHLEVAQKSAENVLEISKYDLKKAETELNDIRRRHEEAMTKRDSYKVADLSKLATELVNVNTAITNHETKQAQLRTVVGAAKSHAEAISLITAEKNPFDDTVAHHDKELVAARGELAFHMGREAGSKMMEVMLADAVKVFGPGGVRAHILDTVTPFLNDRTAEYLGALSDGAITAVWTTLSTTAKGDTKEKFSIEVKHSLGAESFNGLSGGEKRKVRLACAMALQDLVATRATKPIDLFIADEVDHALDESGLERLMGVLEKKAKERGTVLVISHNSLSDWIDNVITVIKEGGFSRVEGGV